MPKKNRGPYGNYALTVDGEQNPPNTSQKKKKVPQNAFYFYMQDFREQEETRGRFYNSQKEVADAAAASWKELSDDERKPYKDAAEEAKEKAKSDLNNKFTTEGKSYAQVNREEQLLKEVQEKMLSEIRGTIRSLRTQPALNNYPFHLVHVNYYCKTLSGMYVPCEIAISEFTLIDGVKRLFHVLINPGDLPLGYRYEAEKHSEETHNIPMPGVFHYEGVVADYAVIFKSLHTFLRDAKAEYKLPPLYTVASQLEPCENVLSNLCDSVNEENIFRVYPAKEMFFELQHACIDVFTSTCDSTAVKLPYTSLAERELEKDIFDFTRGISCTFHEETDALPHCSLSCVQRWSFLILDFCHQATNMPLIPGKHVPLHTNVSKLKKLKSTGQCEKSDTTQLNAAMQKMDVNAGNGATSAWQKPGALNFGGNGHNTGSVHAPKMSEAMRLQSPDESDDEFPALGACRKKMESHKRRTWNPK